MNPKSAAALRMERKQLRAPLTRELDYRREHGFDIFLHWIVGTVTTYVEKVDDRGEFLPEIIEVREGESPLEVFNDPRHYRELHEKADGDVG